MAEHDGEVPVPSADDLRALLDFLPRFEAPGFRAGEMKSEPGTLPFSVLNPQIERFIDELHARGFVYAFDWTDWAPSAREYFERPALLEDATLDTIRRLFFVIVRQERYCEGTILDVFETGFVLAALRRMAKLIPSA